MNDDMLKAALQKSLQQPPSRYFNEQVLHRLPAPVKARQKHFLSLDDAWLLVWVLVLLLGGAWILQSPAINSQHVLLLLTLAALGIFVMLFNRITRSALRKPQ
ncbi:hypothetical protein DCC81_04145 [Chitinophaga parva]|uniref:Uncharacterized protein n=1 Tax=Chitinophaga parva TaxID=2169414 RepID=A0A2T7BLX4_9BACT|nr:hypothetical protein [Chitinophaga parva]PUZ28683.1 hypothetical protein DCC81_04145 [Chitinophaga parva]